MTIDVRLGAMALAFDADVVRLPLDDPCVLVLAARATERRGLGRAEGEMRIAVEGERTRTRVSITAELQLQGGVLQYSRGMLPEVAGQITQRLCDSRRSGARGGVIAYHRAASVQRAVAPGAMRHSAHGSARINRTGTEL